MLFCEDIYTLLLNEKATEFDYVILGRNSTKNKQRARYVFNNYHRFIEIDNYSNLVSLIFQLPYYLLKNKNKLKEFVKFSDKILIMTPSPISILIIKYAIKFKKEYYLLIRQDSREMIPKRYTGIKKIVATITANFLESYIEKLVQKQNSRVLALGPVIAERYARFSNRIYTFSSSRYKLEDIIKERSLPPINFNTPVKLIFVGRIEINKGIYELLNAIKYCENYELTLVGDGQYLDNAKQLIFKLGLSQKVNSIGFVPFGPDLLRIYRTHDILILPSYSEGLPQVIFEAMASGCLVLATKVGSIPYIIQHERNGLLFQPQSTSSIIELLMQLQSNTYDFQEIRKNGLLTAREYSFEYQSKILFEAFHS